MCRRVFAALLILGISNAQDAQHWQPAAAKERGWLYTGCPWVSDSGGRCAVADERAHVRCCKSADSRKCVSLCANPAMPAKRSELLTLGKARRKCLAQACVYAQCASCRRTRAASRAAGQTPARCGLKTTARRHARPASSCRLSTFRTIVARDGLSTLSCGTCLWAPQHEGAAAEMQTRTRVAGGAQRYGATAPHLQLQGRLVELTCPPQQVHGRQPQPDGGDAFRLAAHLRYRRIVPDQARGAGRCSARAELVRMNKQRLYQHYGCS